MLEYGDRWAQLRGKSEFSNIYEHSLADFSSLAAPQVDPLQNVLALFDCSTGSRIRHSADWIDPGEQQKLHLEDRIVQAFVEFFAERFIEQRSFLGLPFDAEIIPTVHRLYSSNPISNRPQIWMALSCCCSYGEQEKYLFFESTSTDNFYALSCPVLMSIRGTINNLPGDSGWEYRQIFSLPAFAELMQIARRDLHDLPLSMLNEICWRIDCQSRSGLAQPAFFQKEVDGRENVFVTDTVSAGFFTIQFGLDPYGEIDIRVQPAKYDFSWQKQRRFR